MSDFVPNIINFVIALFTAWAAWEAKKSVKINKGAAVSQLFYSMLMDYYNPTMSKDLIVLDLWRKKYGDSFVNEWFERLGTDEAALAVDRARLRVKGYFVAIHSIYRSSLVTEELKELWCVFLYSRALSIFKEVVVPMERKMSRENKNSIWRDISDVLDTIEEIKRTCERDGESR